MAVVQLLGLLLLKHGVLAHVIDFGYSAARRSGYRLWGVALVLHCLAEMVGTLFVLSNFSLPVALVVLLVEFAGLATSSTLEREAPLNRLLLRHVLCETGMLVTYVFLSSYLASQK